jgi:hypothetical protein
MICDVVLSKDKDQFVAKIKDWPEIFAKDKVRDKAINKVKSKLLDYLTNKVELVQIDVPIKKEARNPWLDHFGWFKDDPTFDDLQARITLFRREIDQ